MEPFSPDNHAADEPVFHPAGPDEGDRVRRLVSRHYPALLEGDDPIEVIGDVNINSSNFRIGSSFVKVIDAAAPRDDVPLFPDMTSELARHGIPVGRFLDNAAGEPLTRIDSGDGAAAQYLYAQEYLRAGFYTGAPAEFAQGVDLVARLLPALASIEPSPGQHEPYRSWSPVDVLAGIDEALRARTGDEGPWTARFAEARSRLDGLAGSYEERRDELGGRHLVHYDLHPHNLMFRDGELAAVLDLESFRVMPPQIAVAFDLFKLGRKPVSLGRVDIEQVKTIASERFDLPALRELAKFEVLRRLLYLFEQWFVHGSDRWGAEVDKQLVALEEIDLLLG